MSEAQKHVDQIVIKVGGQDLPTPLMDALVEVVADLSLHLPDMFIMRFHDDDLQWVDEGPFAPGAAVEIELGKEGKQTQRVLSGEITAIEPGFAANTTALLTIRGYDRSHRLTRGTKTRVYTQVTDTDIVTQLAEEAGLQVEAEATSIVYDHVFQHGQTDLAFLQDRAAQLGFEVFVDDRTLYFRQPQGERGEIALDWGDELRSFAPRLSLAGQVDEVSVQGWDPKTKQPISGQATASKTAPQIQVGGQGGEVAASAFSAARQVVVKQPVASQAAADSLAQAILDEINAGFVEAAGVAIGNPALLAGQLVKLSGLGKRFSGKYMVTAAVHSYSAQRAYEVRFSVEGARPSLMADLVAPAAGSRKRADDAWVGVVPAIVTNNKDEQAMGRVKVKFPWLDDNLESDWARISGVGAGQARGLFWLPEVQDEVLVAFEHGDFGRPYVVGGLWNGQDAPPETTAAAVQNGKVHTRTLKTRTGHMIRFVDDDMSDQYIEIMDAASETLIKLDTKSRAVTITASGDITLEAGGNITLEARRSIMLSAGSNIELEASAISAKGTSDIALDAQGDLQLKTMGSLSAEAAAAAKLDGGASTTVSSNGVLTVRGSLVKLN